MNENILGIIAAILTSTAMIPQLIKALKEKRVEDLSIVMLLFGITGVSLWLWYGLLKNDFPIILSNAVALIVNMSLFICYLIYKKK